MKIELSQNGKGDGSSSILHAVIVPFPAQGHISPALQLAKKLVGLGFRITFVNTVHTHERIMKSRSKAMEPDHKENIEFVSVSDGLPDDHPRVGDLIAFCNATLEMGPVFEEFLVNLLLKSPITCVIRDVVLPAIHERAKSLGIPVVGFATSSAIALHCIHHLPTFTAAGMLPIPPPPAHVPAPSLNPFKFTLGPPQSEQEAAVRHAPLTCLPGASPTMRVEDLPTTLLSHDLNSFFLRFYRGHFNSLTSDCECILFNTFYDLEGDVLDAMRGVMNSSIYSLGPLVVNSTSDGDGVVELSLAGAGSALWEEDTISLSWLDDQNPTSVVFVSFGSVATISIEQVQEFACGLEMSRHAFLWVIRPDLIENMRANKEFQIMFSDFVIRTRERALLVPWAPQTAVLSHPAVASFFTHCGWNSTIESISCGVPMLAWPIFSDQNTNCHYITNVWKIGLDFKSFAKEGTAFVSKEEVAKKVRKIMAKDETDLEVDKIRTNARNLQSAARKAVGKGGSSQTALMKFVEHIVRITEPQHPSS